MRTAVVSPCSSTGVAAGAQWWGPGGNLDRFEFETHSWLRASAEPSLRNTSVSCHTGHAAEQILQRDAVARFQVARNGFWPHAGHLYRTIWIIRITEEHVPGYLTMYADRLDLPQNSWPATFEHRRILPRLKPNHQKLLSPGLCL